jgi:hypothetical protein
VHYEKFLDLWTDADPGIAEVDANKKPAVVSKRGLMMGTIGGSSLQPIKENCV